RNRGTNTRCGEPLGTRAAKPRRTAPPHGIATLPAATSSVCRAVKIPGANRACAMYHRVKTHRSRPCRSGGCMSTASSLYPLGPEIVPEDLTRVSGAFRQQATFLILLIVVFFLLYAGLMFLAGYLLWLGISLPVHRRDVAGGVILKIFLIPTGLLLL